MFCCVCTEWKAVRCSAEGMGQVVGIVNREYTYRKVYMKPHSELTPKSTDQGSCKDIKHSLCEIISFGDEYNCYFKPLIRWSIGQYEDE